MVPEIPHFNLPSQEPSFLFLMFLILEGEVNIWDRKGAPWRWWLFFYGSGVLNRVSIATYNFCNEVCAHCAGWVHFMSYIKSGLGHAPLWGSKTNPTLRFIFLGTVCQTLFLGQDQTFHFIWVDVVLEIIGWLVPCSNLEVVFVSFSVSAVEILTGILSNPMNSSVFQTCQSVWVCQTV